MGSAGLNGSGLPQLGLPLRVIKRSISLRILILLCEAPVMNGDFWELEKRPRKTGRFLLFVNLGIKTPYCGSSVPLSRASSPRFRDTAMCIVAQSSVCRLRQQLPTTENFFAPPRHSLAGPRRLSARPHSKSLERH